MLKRSKGFSIAELLVVIGIIALLMGILLPALSVVRQSARQMTSNTQMRGVIQTFNVFAEDNNNWYPGVDGSTGYYAVTPFNFSTFFQGEPYTISLSNFNANEVELAICLNYNLFGPRYPVSPGETNPNIKPAAVPDAGSQTILNKNGPNNSYAMLRVDNRYGTSNRDAGRLAECRSNMTANAVILSDRGMRHKSANDKEYLTTTSIWTDNTQTATSHPEQWVGGVAWGDGHVSTYKSAVMGTTSYAGIANRDDNLFKVNDGNNNSDSNAYMAFGNFKDVPGLIGNL